MDIIQYQNPAGQADDTGSSIGTVLIVIGVIAVGAFIFYPGDNDTQAWAEPPKHPRERGAPQYEAQRGQKSPWTGHYRVKKQSGDYLIVDQHGTVVDDTMDSREQASRWAKYYNKRWVGSDHNILPQFEDARIRLEEAAADRDIARHGGR